MNYINIHSSRPCKSADHQPHFNTCSFSVLAVARASYDHVVGGKKQARKARLQKSGFAFSNRISLAGSKQAKPRDTKPAKKSWYRSLGLSAKSSRARLKEIVINLQYAR